jgi:hypothetical protein
MPTRRSVSAKRPQSSRGVRGGSTERVEFRRWWTRVRRQLKSRPRFSDEAPPCKAPLSSESGSDFYYHDISAEYATEPSVRHVDFKSVPFKFGVGVPVTYKVTPTGYSFSGGLPVCTKSSVCTNGKPLVWQVNMTGEVKTSTSSAPDKMTYKYSVDVLCGTTWTCRERGTFEGSRKAGKAGAVEGSFYGVHQWQLECCPTRSR